MDQIKSQNHVYHSDSRKIPKERRTEGIEKQKKKEPGINPTTELSEKRGTHRSTVVMARQLRGGGLKATVMWKAENLASTQCDLHE